MASGIDTARCNTRAVVDPLAERDLLAHGLTSDDSLTDRDEDRIRLLKFVASKPEGIVLSNLVHYVLKGVNPNTYTGLYDLSGDEWERHDRKLDSIADKGESVPLNGSDADYQFARRFLPKAEDAGLVLLDDSPAGAVAHPTTELLDLISAGISETPGADNSLVYDREFVQRILESTNSLSESQKQFFGSALQSYIQRIEDYRLAFDVQLHDHRGRGGSRRMTKRYKTRFNDDGRIKRGFARFNDALEHAYGSAENAVLVTLTSDPGTHADDERPDPRSLLDLTQSINPNFHRLTQYMASDPSTKGDTREPDIAPYRPDRADDVTSRPRERLDYIKALEFTELGLPHLHVLFFDVPTDENGMPYLMHKQELSDKWSDYGQGQIVDAYPLVYRDDLDDLDGAEFAEDEGFVCWYRYGENDLGPSTVEDRSRSHRVDMAGNDENPMQKTAGSYLGKYLSMTFAALLDETSESLDDQESYAEKFASWKLAMYWATQKQFWSISRSIERAIDRDDRLDDDAARAVRWAAKKDVMLACEAVGEGHFSAGDLDDLDDADRSRSAVSQVVASPRVQIDYLGTYRYDDLPARWSRSATTLETVDEKVNDPDEPVRLASRGDRPPPITDAWA
jgi:hypothetical protein